MCTCCRLRHRWATVGGGKSNSANGTYSTVAGGRENYAAGFDSGDTSQVTTASTVSGGWWNTASSAGSTVGQ